MPVPAPTPRLPRSATWGLLAGWHAVPHVASAVVTRGYTPGVLTAPALVVPFALWARSRLRRAGVPVTPTARAAALFGPLVVVGAHVAASGLLRLADRWRQGRRAGNSP